MHWPATLASVRQFLETVLLAVAALFPIVDPLGGAPIYLAMTAGLRPEERAPMAQAVAVNSFLLLLASTLVGAYVLDFFGLSIPVVQVAGGALVCAAGWSLLNKPDVPTADARTAASTVATDALRQRAFYPLTMPLTVGPGSISVAVTLGANPAQGARSLIITTLAHIVGILVVAVSVYVCYRYAAGILKKLGATGTSVVLRLSAFILLCIGVQIGWNGIHTLIAGAFPGVVR